MPLKLQHPSKRPLDYYVGIGLILAGFIVGIAWISVKYRLNWPGIRWFGLAFITPLAFWYPAQMFKVFWKRVTFWLVFSTLVALHVLAFARILQRYPDWRLVWFIPTTIIEGMLVILILHAVFPEKRRHAVKIRSDDTDH